MRSTHNTGKGETVTSIFPCILQFFREIVEAGQTTRTHSIMTGNRNHSASCPGLPSRFFGTHNLMDTGTGVMIGAMGRGPVTLKQYMGDAFPAH